MKHLSLLSLTLIAGALLTSGCATDSGDPAKDRRARVANALLESAGETLGKFAVASLQNVVNQELNGGNVDFASAAAQGGYTAAGSLVTSAQVERVIKAWSGDKLPATAAAAGEQFAAATASGVPPSAVVNAIASVISASTLAK